MVSTLHKFARDNLVGMIFSSYEIVLVSKNKQIPFRECCKIWLKRILDQKDTETVILKFNVYSLEIVNNTTDSLRAQWILTHWQHLINRKKARPFRPSPCFIFEWIKSKQNLQTKNWKSSCLLFLLENKGFLTPRLKENRKCWMLFLKRQLRVKRTTEIIAAWKFLICMLLILATKDPLLMSLKKAEIKNKMESQHPKDSNKFKKVHLKSKINISKSLLIC
jgi:hypothetical protein